MVTAKVCSQKAKNEVCQLKPPKNNETLPFTAAKERAIRKTIRRTDEIRSQSVPDFTGIVKSQLPLEAIMPAIKKAMYCGKNGN